MAKLNQIIALVNGTKARTQKTITEVYHKLQKKELVTGISRLFSGAINESSKRSLLLRCEEVQDALKVAREEANSIKVTDVKIGANIF